MKKVKKSLVISLAILIVSIIVVSVGISFSQLLDNDVQVAENSDLTYYLDVIYDGKDSNVITSSDSATADVNSDYIYVEDKIPEGLTFKEFVSSSDGTIGAVKRGENGGSCPGYVVGGVDGLEYNEETRTVSFKVKNLQAGCKLTVGIVTTTPSLNGKDRMDFYNTAVARENDFSVNSNTVHVFMGKENAELFTVNYTYTGTIPENAPEVPPAVSYASGTSVGVSTNPVIPGYTFTGWTTSDVTVSNDAFTMPSKNVTFVGSFTKKETYKVSYSISGVAPEGYMVPREKEYSHMDDVTVDSLKSGDVINGYRFLGWETSDVEITDNIFQMPEANVKLVGKFERVSYKVTYKFQGVNIPTNADSLLPIEKTYYPGDEVKVANDPTATGYKFLGWYSASTFEMPEEDVVIVGEWMIEAGTFSPVIDKAIKDKHDYYKKGETVTFEITVRNTASYAIKDVLLEESLNGATFVSGDGYELLNEKYAKITTIPANGSIVVTAKYVAGDDFLKEYTNKVVLKGALADGNNNLDTTKEYEATAKFTVSNIKLVVNKLDEKQKPLDGSEFTLYSDMSLTSELAKGLEFNGLFPETTYYLKETKAPTGYQLLSKSLKVSVNASGEVAIENYQVTNDDGVATVNVVNKKIDVLPNTGGLGNIVYVLIGLIVIGGASALAILYIKKKDKVKNK